MTAVRAAGDKLETHRRRRPLAAADVSGDAVHQVSLAIRLALRRAGLIAPPVRVSGPRLMRRLGLHANVVFASLLCSQITAGPPLVEQSEKHDQADVRRGRLELGKTIWVNRVQKPGEEPQDLLTLLPPEETFTHGIIPEAIVGILKHPLKEGEPIDPEDFVRNKLFNDFMHEVIARHGPKLQGLQTEARRQGDGWVYLVDARTVDSTPSGSDRSSCLLLCHHCFTARSRTPLHGRVQGLYCTVSSTAQ